MSIRERVHALVREVELGRFVEAIDANYADDASSHEPTGIITTGKPALLAKERAFLTTVEKWNVIEALEVLVDGEMAAIHWRFELTRSGQRIRLEEIALQTVARRRRPCAHRARAVLHLPAGQHSQCRRRKKRGDAFAPPRSLVCTSATSLARSLCRRRPRADLRGRRSSRFRDRAPESPACSGRRDSGMRPGS